LGELTPGTFRPVEGWRAANELTGAAGHSLRFAYPQDVVSRALEAGDELMRLAAAGAFPFDRAAHIESARGSYFSVLMYSMMTAT
jgi:hypothetical protein